MNRILGLLVLFITNITLTQATLKVLVINDLHINRLTEDNSNFTNKFGNYTDMGTTNRFDSPMLVVERVITKAAEVAPDVDLILVSGDLVQHNIEATNDISKVE